MRIALLGAGRIGHVHASHLVRDRRVSELLIADTDARRAAALADACGPAASATSVDGAFAAAPQAVIIAAPTPAHGVLLRRCVEAELPTLCEKPLAQMLEETLELVRLVESAGTVVQVGLMRRFEPGNVELRRLIAAGALGTVLCVRAASHDREPPDEQYADGSGGIFRDQLIHDFDAIRWVTQREVRSVFATGTIRSLEFLRRLGDFDTATALLQMDDGVPVVLAATRMDGRGEDYRIEVIGTGDSVATGTNERTPLRLLDATPDTPPGAPYDGPIARFGMAYEAQTTHFLSVASGEATSRATPRDALASVLVSIAAERSIASGATEQVATPDDLL